MAAAAGIEAEFIASNIYELPDRYQGKFDIALITIGVLSWMPDLTQFFEIAAGLLRPQWCPSLLYLCLPQLLQPARRRCRPL